VRIDARVLVVTLALAALGAPRATPGAHASDRAEVVFAREDGVTTLPFDDVGGLVFVRVSVERSRPLAFVLDSGAARMVIDRRVADELGLRRVGSGRIGGAGGGGVPVDYVRDVTLALAGITSRGHELATADLRPLEATVGRRVEGVLGYELFARLVVEIDYPAGEVTLRAPERYTYRGPGVELPLDLERHWPFVRGEIMLDDGSVVADRFLVDTGSSDTVDHPMVLTLPGRRETTTGVGLGTPTRGYIGRAKAFRIGGFTIDSPTVACCGGTEDTSRLIGSGVLGRFHVIFDYPRRRLILMSEGAGVR
jgi:predicted aspartyl protease